MSDLVEKTKECRYKGVSLLVNKVTSTDGRTNIEHLLSNTDRRVVRDGGGFPSEFSVSGTLHSTGFSWQEYTDRINQLRSVLNSELPGEFIHPLFGTFFCKHGKYTIDYDTAKTGRTDYQISLLQCDRNGNPLTPTGQIFSKPQIKKMALAANRKLQAASAASLTHDNMENKTNTKSALSRIADKMKSTFASIGQTIAKATNFAGKAFALKDKASFYADNPFLLFAAISDNLLGIDGLTVDAFIKINKIKDLFDFGADGSDTDLSVTSPRRIPAVPLTREEAERTNNANTMVNFMRAGAIIEYMGYSAEVEPNTTEEIDTIVSDMAESFEVIKAKLVDDTTDDNNLFYYRPDYSEVIESMDALYSAADGYLRQRRETTPQVRTITVPEMPVDVLAYLLYEDSTRGSQIMKLNGFTDPSAVSGEIMVLSK
jgi:hypothetical protein